MKNKTRKKALEKAQTFKDYEQFIQEEKFDAGGKFLKSSRSKKSKKERAFERAEETRIRHLSRAALERELLAAEIENQRLKQQLKQIKTGKDFSTHEEWKKKALKLAKRSKKKKLIIYTLGRDVTERWDEPIREILRTYELLLELDGLTLHLEDLTYQEFGVEGQWYLPFSTEKIMHHLETLLIALENKSHGRNRLTRLDPSDFYPLLDSIFATRGDYDGSSRYNRTEFIAELLKDIKW